MTDAPENLVPYGEAGRALGVSPNSLRYGAPTGTILIRWAGAGQPTVWAVPPPAIEPREARLELARRHLHIFDPTTPEAFARMGRDQGAGRSRRVRSARGIADPGADADRRCVDPVER